MPEPEALAESVPARTNDFVGDATLGDALTRIAGLTIRSLPQARMVAITVMVDGQVGTYVFTHPEIEEIDRAQYAAGDGPSLHAFNDNEVVMIESTARSDRWTSFCAVAAEHGVASTLSVPLTTDRATLGALNLYAAVEDAFSEADAEYAQVLATQAAFLVSNARAYWDARTLSENLRTAMESRAEIEQAKGIIMAATGCTADEAFEQLRAQSQHENMKLREIAIRIVAGTQRRKRDVT